MLGLPDWDSALRLLNIVIIDLALSGDNAIVIGMAAASLPRSQRRLAVLIGGSAAITLRVLLSAVATILMLVPGLSIIGGLVLIGIVHRLLKLDVGRREKTQESKGGKNLREAVFVILAADFLMSLDNVIAIAGSAHGNVVLLIAGLLMSMPLLMATGGAISLLIDKVRWLVFVGAFALSFSAARMILGDPFIEAACPRPAPVVMIVALLVGLLIPAVFAWRNNIKPWRI
jgi:YjbE family integral membrane protein